MIAATPPFATKEPATDEAVEEVAEVVGEAGEEAVLAPSVVGFAVVLAPAALAEPQTPAVPDRVNGILLTCVGLGPVALRLTVLRRKEMV